MRKLLATAVALGPLLVATGAMAETVISNTRTTPVETATAGTGGTADNVRIADNGTVSVNTGAAVTLNSNNTVTNQGAIKFENAADGATGIQVVGGNTGSVTNSGTITIADDFTPSDTDNDGDSDGPYAHGTNRAGIRLSGGASAFTGSILNDTSGNITVDGNQSYGILIAQQMVGDLTNKGIIRVVGDGSYGIRTTDDITGLVTVRGSVSMTGAGSTAVSLEDNVSGRVTLGGAITSTGYRYTTRPGADALAKLDADDLLQGGPAVVIGANMLAGVLVDAAVADKDTNNPDEDADGVADTNQTAGSIAAYGGAPGVLVGSTTHSVTLSPVGAAAAYNYGFVNKGSIGGFGVYDSIQSIGMQIGTCSSLQTSCVGPLQTTLITGGIRNVGGIQAASSEASSTALVFGHLSSIGPTGVLQNEGNIQAISVAETAAPITGRNSIAVLIESTATVPTLVNLKSGTISASVSGENANAFAILDRSGTLSNITNSGAISAVIAPTDGNDAGDSPSDEIINGAAIAMDLRANTTGVTITQTGVNDGDDNGDGVADADEDGDGVDDVDEPLIYGAVLLGTGDDKLNFNNGFMQGQIQTGAGADQLNINGGAKVTASIIDSDHNLSIDVNNGDLTVQNALLSNVADRTVQGTSLHVGANGNLIVTFDPNAPTTAMELSGAATFDSGAGLGVRFSRLVTNFDSNGQAHFLVLQAASVAGAGGLDLTTLTNNVPYLYVVGIDGSTAANQLGVVVSRRSAASAGMITAEAAAYDSVYAALGADTELRDAFLAQTTRKDFFNLYEQLLPDHSGGPVLSLASGVDAVSRALSDRRPESEQGEVTGWLQEINFYADKDRDGAYGFRSDGFGIAGGLEKNYGGFGAVGLSFAFTSSDLKDPEAEGDENLTAQLIELGGYWRAAPGNWRLWARAAGGWGMFDSKRDFVGGGVTRENTSSWNGVSFAAAGGVAYEASFGRFYIRPEASIEWFSLREDAHDENGGGSGFDLSIAERNGRLGRGSVMLSFGGRFGDQGWLQPEIRIGYRSNMTAELDDTVACFTALAPSDPNRCFSLPADSIEGGGPVFGFRLLATGQMGYLALEGDAELLDMYQRYSLMLRAGYRF